MSIEMIGGGDGLSLLRDCAQNCADNGGDWYTPEQVLSVLSECVGNPALLGDSAFIGLATPERILDLFRQRDTLIEAAQRVIDIGKKADFVSGVCCCGISMDRHAHRSQQDHAPVDTGDRYGRDALDSLQHALSEFGAK